MGYCQYLTKIRSNWKNLSSSQNVWLANIWYHFVFTYNDTDMSLYVNGAKDTNPFIEGAGSAVGMHTNATSAYLGGGTPSPVQNPIAGQIDEFKVYNYALSANDITTYYNANKPVLSAIALSKSSDSVNASANYNLSTITTTASYSNIPNATVTPTWSIVSRGGSLNDTTYTAPAVAGMAVLRATYIQHGVTKTADLTLTVLGLVAYYAFEDNANDTSGLGNNDTANGGMTYATGVVGKAANFDGVDDFVNSNYSGASKITVMMWMYLPANKLGYVIGGNDENNAHLTSTDVYDPTTDSWTTLPATPSATYESAAAVVDGKIYVISGTDSTGNYTDNVFAFDFTSNAWTRKAPFPRSAYTQTASAVNGKIYVTGCYDGTVYADMYEFQP